MHLLSHNANSVLYMAQNASYSSLSSQYPLLHISLKVKPVMTFYMALGNYDFSFLTFPTPRSPFLLQSPKGRNLSFLLQLFSKLWLSCWTWPPTRDFPFYIAWMFFLIYMHCLQTPPSLIGICSFVTWYSLIWFCSCRQP